MILPVIVAVWGVVISAIYMLRAYRSTFWGPMSDRWNALVDINPSVRWSVILLIAPLMIVGFYPQLILKMVTTALPR